MLVGIWTPPYLHADRTRDIAFIASCIATWTEGNEGASTPYITCKFYLAVVLVHPEPSRKYFSAQTSTVNALQLDYTK